LTQIDMLLYSFVKDRELLRFDVSIHRSIYKYNSIIYLFLVIPESSE